MKNLPLTNFEKFEKIIWTKPWSPNCEMFWHGTSTYHYQYKNSQTEGIEIEWDDNPFESDFNFDYVLDK